MSDITLFYLLVGLLILCSGIAIFYLLKNDESEVVEKSADHIIKDKGASLYFAQTQEELLFIPKSRLSFYYPDEEVNPAHEYRRIFNQYLDIQYDKKEIRERESINSKNPIGTKLFKLEYHSDIEVVFEKVADPTDLILKILLKFLIEKKLVVCISKSLIDPNTDLNKLVPAREIFENFFPQNKEELNHKIIELNRRLLEKQIDILKHWTDFLLIDGDFQVKVIQDPTKKETEILFTKFHFMNESITTEKKITIKIYCSKKNIGDQNFSIFKRSFENNKIVSLKVFGKKYEMDDLNYELEIIPYVIYKV